MTERASIARNWVFLAFRPFAGLIVLVAASILGVGAAREVAIGRQELAAADVAIGRHDWPEAVRHARAAAESFVPTSPWSERGEQRLEAIGHDAEARGDGDIALLAYGAARTAALATTGPGSSGIRWRAAAEAGLARVASWDSSGSVSKVPTPPTHGTAQTMLDALQHDDTPSTWVFAALSASTLAVLLGVGWLAMSGGRGVQIARSLVAFGLVAYAVVMLAN